MVSKNLHRPSRHQCGWSLQVYGDHPICFVNIYISWNGLRKLYETIQNVMLMHKLIRILSVFFTLVGRWEGRSKVFLLRNTFLIPCHKR